MRRPVPGPVTGMTVRPDGEPVPTLTTTWRPPADEGGSPVTSYLLVIDTDSGHLEVEIARSEPAAEQTSGTSTELGEHYTMSLSAVNAQGVGPQTAVSGTVTGYVPGAPGEFSTVVDRAADTATVTWDPPTYAGSGPVAGYAVSVNGVEHQVPADTTSWTVPDQHGRTETIGKVAAVNAYGTGRYAPWNVLYTDVPGPPTVKTAGAVGGFRIRAIAHDDGGSPVTGIRVLVDGAPVLEDLQEATPYLVDGHEAGSTHVVEILASNEFGYGAPARETVVVPNVPKAPAIRRAVPGAVGGSLSALARWDLPGWHLDDWNGLPPGSFRATTYRAVGHRWVRVRRTFVKHTELGVELSLERQGRYCFEVQARNAVGFGPPSARSNAVRAR